MTLVAGRLRGYSAGLRHGVVTVGTQPSAATTTTTPTPPQTPKLRTRKTRSYESPSPPNATATALLRIPPGAPSTDHIDIDSCLQNSTPTARYKMASASSEYEVLELIGTIRPVPHYARSELTLELPGRGSFGQIRKVRRKSDGLVGHPLSPYPPMFVLL